MVIALVILAIILICSASYEALSRRQERFLPLPGRQVEIGGRRLHTVEKGEGGPTVVIIPGGGDSSYSWMHVQAVVSRFTRVIAYDRPGLGSSEPGPAPTPDSLVLDLAALLERTGAPGPYILVGHSLGGLIARAYTLQYPERVAGIVLVDSTPEVVAGSKAIRTSFSVIRSLLRIIKAIAPLGLVRVIGDLFGAIPMYPERKAYAGQISRDEYRQWKAAVYRTFASDAHNEFPVVFTLAEALTPQARPGEFGNLPLIVLTSPTFGGDWIEWHREMATRSTNSAHRISQLKGHGLQLTSPEMVTQAIDEVLTAVRTGRPIEEAPSAAAR